MTDTIEPTEEQNGVALALCQRSNYVYESDGIVYRAMIDVSALARLLAEREHKLREEVATKYADFIDALNGWKAAEAENDTLRADARVAEKERDAARAEIARLQALNAEPVAHPELDAARARIAELEAESQRLREERHSWMDEAVGARQDTRQHLAHIKALHQFLGDREEEEGIWIPRAEFKDMPKHDTAHYDVEGEKAPCTHGTRTWNVIDQTMRCKVCDDEKAGAK